MPAIQIYENMSQSYPYFTSLLIKRHQTPCGMSFENIIPLAFISKKQKNKL